MFGLFRRASNRRLVERLHGDIVAAVRRPAFYAEMGVADTFDGRFELLALFSSLVVRRLARMESPGPELAQELTDAVFTHLDDDLREMGVGDIVVPKRIKKLAAALLGRRKAFDQALEKDDDGELAVVIARNVHAERLAPGDPRLLRLLRYIKAAQAALNATPIETFLDGPTPLPDPASVA